MNIGFFDPISERWIKPRPEPTREIPEAVSLGEALLAAVEAAKVKERNEKIWALLKQSAEGVNAPTVAEPSPIVTSEPPEYVQPSEPVMVMHERLVFTQGGPPEVVWSGPPPFAVEPVTEYEPVESLGYVYWRKKETV